MCFDNIEDLGEADPDKISKDLNRMDRPEVEVYSLENSEDQGEVYLDNSSKDLNHMY